MTSIDPANWVILKKSIGKWLKKGVVVFQRGTLVVKRQESAMSEDGKRQYQLMVLKTKVHNGISELGARVYSLLGAKKDNPATDAKVKDITAHIKRYEAEITLLEKKHRKGVKRKIGKLA